MAKKSAIIGEYIVTVENTGAVRVCKIYDNVLDSLRECADSVKFKFAPTANTLQLGKLLVDNYGDGHTATIGEYTVMRAANGHIDTYRMFGNTKRVLEEIGAGLNFPRRPYWQTRYYGSCIIDLANGVDAATDVECTADDGLAVEPDMTTFQLYEAFRDIFGGHLRIKKGAQRCDPNKRSEGIDCTLAEIGLKSGAKYSGDLTVGEFTAALKESGLNVVVATSDDWVAALDGFALDAVGLIPNNTTKEKMQEILDR